MHSGHFHCFLFSFWQFSPFFFLRLCFCECVCVRGTYPYFSSLSSDFKAEASVDLDPFPLLLATENAVLADPIYASGRDSGCLCVNIIEFRLSYFAHEVCGCLWVWQLTPKPRPLSNKPNQGRTGPAWVRGAHNTYI